MAAAALGLVPASIVAAVTEAFTPERLTLDERRFLRGPLIVHQNGWTDTLPTWLADAARAERIGIVFGQTPQFIVGPAEIAAVMYPATLQAPMYHDHADLYIWATVSADAKRKNVEVAARFIELGWTPIHDDEVLARGGRLHETYRRLAEDIRRRVINAQADRERGEKRQEQKENVMQREQTPNEDGHDIPPRTKPWTRFEQASLFDGDE